MDRSWMKADRLGPVYEKGVLEFLEYTDEHLIDNNEIVYQCTKYGVSRYKLKANNGDDNDNDNVSRKHRPAKVLWYLPIISRFNMLFSNLKGAKNIRWHADEKTHDGNIRHVADSLQWKKIDSLFLDFGVEPRNLRLGLATDGMNPFGVEVDDAYFGEKFKMRAILFCTIKKFPAYGNLAGYSVKGYKACPICEDNTCYHQLEFRKKTVYLGHRKFLKPGHPYRRLRKAFNEEQEFDEAPKPLIGDEVYQRQEHINVVFGKRQKEKWELAPIEKGKRTYMPLACHTLSKKKKKIFCEYLQGIKFSQGYSSNMKKLVSMKDIKLIGLKSHDFHVLMQQPLLMAIRGILPKNVRVTIIRLCLFFNAICNKVIDFKNLDELEDEASIILCQLDIYFPPSFFDIMVHLLVHLVREIKFCGPVYLRWMYPIEQYMNIFEGYTKNHH
ncbi:uncharacterized protein LOC131605318 [Vicia villosa]|uniref:uncharacterized protein LOC131605318 n=1 Tax=Vicia villosa TaxID=3911 RepID=UPI00273C3482|nr:uncharacterized protein LOC131605318 [Vicia villosa]